MPGNEDGRRGLERSFGIRPLNEAFARLGRRPLARSYDEPLGKAFEWSLCNASDKALIHSLGTRPWYEAFYRMRPNGTRTWDGPWEDIHMTSPSNETFGRHLGTTYDRPLHGPSSYSVRQLKLFRWRIKRNKLLTRCGPWFSYKHVFANKCWLEINNVSKPVVLRCLAVSSSAASRLLICVTASS